VKVILISGLLSLISAFKVFAVLIKPEYARSGLGCWILDRVLTSLVRQRILLALQEGELHINELARRTNSTYTRVSTLNGETHQTGIVYAEDSNR